jgi:hypothetical protein
MYFNRLSSAVVGVSSAHYYRYLNALTTCFGLTGHLQVYSLVCRSFQVTFLGWHCAAVHMFPIYGAQGHNRVQKFLTRGYAINPKSRII